MASIRLDKYLADMQVGTRSEVKILVRQKRVKVNGEVIKDAGLRIDLTADEVRVDDKLLGYEEFEYFMLNKPKGVVSATKDDECETVVDLIKAKQRKDLFPVGRLDKDTEGLLLITNDGELSHRLLSPKKHVDKMYYARVKGRITDRDVEKFAGGLKINEEFEAMPAKLEVLGYDDSKDVSEITVVIKEGKYHQVKRMFIAVGSEVLYLKRLSMGKLKLDESLAPGDYRRLTKEEICLLK